MARDLLYKTIYSGRKVISTISFLIKANQNLEFLSFDVYQKNNHVV